MKLITPFLLAITLLLGFVATAQSDDVSRPNWEGIYKDNIKSVRFYAGGSLLSYPITTLQGSTPMVLSFDDLDADVKDYSYTIIHCNADWTVSQLSSLEYIDGFETEDILDYEYSFNTLVNYTHYQLALPNENMAFTKSGNYLLRVFEDNDQENVVLTRRFVVVDTKVTIEYEIERPSVLSKVRSHQEIDFSINHTGFQIRNPREEVKVVMMQNGRWSTAVEDIKPLFVKGSTLLYDYQDKFVFPAGKEFRVVDLRSTRYRTENVKRLENDQDMYYMYVFTDKKRGQLPYLFEKDINGKYVIENQHESNDDLESDYITTFFTLTEDEPLRNGSIYLYGDLTDWQIKEEYKMVYIEEEQGYALKTLLKQGYYNYAYAYVEDDKSEADMSLMEGNWFETENDYQILVYYRPFGARYDHLIGAITLNSLHW